MDGADLMPYKYRLTFAVTIEGDGQHADGTGALATQRRLEATISADQQVVGVRATHHPIYMSAPRPAPDESTEDQ